MINFKEGPLPPSSELGCSFEEFLLAQYETTYPERRLPCVVCKKMATSAYSYNGRSIDCHGTCLTFALFYYFMHQYDVLSFGRSGNLMNQPSLAKLYEMPFALQSMAEYKKRCVFCGARNAYFKCASENCFNHFHLNCNTNSIVVVHHGKADTKQPSYRFLFCQAHMNNYEVDLVKCRFNSKISLMQEYEFLKSGRLRQRKAPPEPEQAPAATSPVSVTGPYRVTMKGRPNSKQDRSDRKPSANRGSSAIRKIDEFLVPGYAADQAITAQTGGFLSPLSERGGHARDYIACLCNEYGVLKRQGYQKNTKRFEWWPYEILFTKIGTDLFSNATPLSSLADLYKDLRSVLVFDRCVDSLSDLRKLAMESEPCIINVSNSIAMQTKQVTTSTPTNANSSERPNLVTEYIPFVNSSEDKQDSSRPESDSKKEPSEGAQTPSGPPSERRRGQPQDYYELVGRGTHRPTFVLARYGNKAVWLSTVYVRSQKTNNTKMVMLDYINLELLEYEYFKRVLRCMYIYPTLPKAVPVLLAPPVTKTEDRQQEATTVKVGGFSWDLEPTAAAYLKNRLVTSQDTSEPEPVLSGSTLEDIIDVRTIDSNVLFRDTRYATAPCFVTKQANALVGVLKAVNNEIEKHKEVLQAKLTVENAYARRIHEDRAMVEQHMKTAFKMNRWSHFRRSMMQAMETFNNLLRYESWTNSEQYQADKPKADVIKDTTDKEFCSVCLLSEPAHKHLMHQCNRCFIRVHYKCYVTYKANAGDQNNGAPKTDEVVNDWYCEPCEYEVLMNANTKTATCNNAVCCVCYSSGGAFKRVLEPTKRSSGMLPVKWIHLHCAMLLMPVVTCQDWAGLNKWELTHAVFTSGDRCVICTVNGGVMVHCAEPGCSAKFHTTCAWVGGSYVSESPLHNATGLPGMVRGSATNNELFPAMALRMLCIKHTTVLFSEKAVRVLMRRRCFAYTHYLHSPENSPKDSQDPRLRTLPLKPCPSHIVVTRTGAMQSIPVEKAAAKEEAEKAGDSVYEMAPKQRKVPQIQPPAPEMVQGNQQPMMMAQHRPNMVMMNPAHGMVMNYPQGVVYNGGAGMLVNGGPPMYVNGAQAMLNPGHHQMVMNGGHQMMMNTGPPMLMNPQQPPMLSAQHGMMPGGMRKPAMTPLVYGTQPQYVNEQPRYGVSAIASHFSGNSYAQPMGHPGMNSMEVPVQPVMMPYMAPVNAVPMNRTVVPLAQHPQFHPNGYAQPVQMVPKYWNPRANQMQYQDRPPPDNPYIGMGYMEH